MVKKRSRSSRSRSRSRSRSPNDDYNKYQIFRQKDHAYNYNDYHQKQHGGGSNYSYQPIFVLEENKTTTQLELKMILIDDNLDQGEDPGKGDQRDQNLSVNCNSNTL
jgi:hypothetical protein